MSYFDDKTLAFDCPKCGKKIRKTIGGFKKKGNVCPHCGLALDTAQFTREIKKAEQAMADFQRQMSKTLNLKIKF